MKKIMISFILGGITFGTVGVLAATTISSNQVTYQDQTLNNTLDELYDSVNLLKTKGDATASQILTGKTTIVKGIEVTGTMPNRGNLNWAPSTSTSYTVPSGYYSGGTLNSAGAYNTGYNAGVTAADNRANTNSTNYKTGYNAGYSAGSSNGKFSGTFVLGLAQRSMGYVPRSLFPNGRITVTSSGSQVWTYNSYTTSNGMATITNGGSQTYYYSSLSSGYIGFYAPDAPTTLTITVAY